MLQIRAIDQVFVKMNQDRTYQLVQNGIPDIHTQSFLQARTAAVTTVLDPVWFLETSTIVGLQVELQGEATFYTSDEYDLPHLINARQNAYHGLRQLTEAETETGRAGSEKTSKSVLIAIASIAFVLAAVYTVALVYYTSSFVLNQEQRRRSEYWEYIRRRQQDQFEKYLSDHGEPAVKFNDYPDDVSDDSTADLTSTTAQLSGGDEDSMRTFRLEP